MKNQEIKEIVLQARKGDMHALSEIYELYYDRISAYVYKRVLNMDVTQDVVGNTFLKVVKEIGRLKWKSDAHFNGWVYRIATNEVHTYYRKQAKYHLVAPEDVEKYFTDISDKEREEVERKLDSKQDFLTVHVAIKKLKPFYQAIIHMRFFEDLSYEEIAVATKKRAGTIRVSMHRAMERLRDQLGADFHVLEKEYVPIKIHEDR